MFLPLLNLHRLADSPAHARTQIYDSFTGGSDNGNKIRLPSSIKYENIKYE